MKKIICIGECSLNIVLGADGTPLGTTTGGRIANAAAVLARRGLPVSMASEISTDGVGDIVAQYLVDAGVDVHSVDRYTEGRTPVNIFTIAGGAEVPSSLTRYEQYPAEAFDIIWPRVDEGDLILFGGYYALDSRMRPRLMRLLSHCIERKAVLVYLPGYLPQQEPRVTRVMPAVLENLEMSALVVTRSTDLKVIFGSDDAAAVYRDRINFYCPSMINIAGGEHAHIAFLTPGGESSAPLDAATAGTLMWNSGAVAEIARQIFDAALDADTIAALSAPEKAEFLARVVQQGNLLAAPLENSKFLSF